MKIITLILILITTEFVFSQGFVVDHRHTDLSQIPDEYITAAKKDLKIRYFRRSHGSQLDLGGMTSLVRYSAAYETKYAFSKDVSAKSNDGVIYLSTQTSAEPWNSLDFENATWVSITRNYLDDPANADVNVVMWAWSSYFYQCSANQYVNDMEMLISEYGPGGSKSRAVPVTFIFQTACGQKSNDRNQLVFLKNDTIRKHCNSHGRILFDFNDIECYDPDGNYYGDGNPDDSYTNERKLGDDCAYLSSNPGGSVYPDRRNWGIDWMNSNPGTELTTLAGDSYCLDCAHSEGVAEGETKDNSRLHCVLKGRAAWWLWASLAGWEAGQTPTSVYIQKPEIQKSLKNYPNPFTDGTLIEYKLAGNAKVKLSVWNEAGQLISVLVDNNQNKGIYQVPVSLKQNGVYFYTLDVDGQRIAREKMIKM